MAFKIHIKTTEVAMNCNTQCEHAVSNFLQAAFLLEKMFM